MLDAGCWAELLDDGWSCWMMDGWLECLVFYAVDETGGRTEEVKVVGEHCFSQLLHTSIILLK